LIVVPPARDVFPTFLAVRKLWQWSPVADAATDRAEITKPTHDPGDLSFAWRRGASKNGAKHVICWRAICLVTLLSLCACVSASTAVSLIDPAAVGAEVKAAIRHGGVSCDLSLHLHTSRDEAAWH